MAAVPRDARFAVRILLRTPLMTAFIILLLGLGIGANAAMFGMLDGLVLHAVRYPDPETLVFVWSYDAQGQVNDVSAADFLDWRSRAKSITGLAAWMPTSFVVLGGDRPRQFSGARVTANFFRTLGVKPVLGRTFLPDEDGLEHPEKAGRSVVISYRLWQEDLGADPNVLGRSLRVDSLPYTIVGVAPPDFQFWWRPHDLWIPVSLNIHDRDYRDLVVIARLVGSRAGASAEMELIARSLSDAYPKSDKGWTIHVDELQEWLLNRTFRMRLLLLSGAVGLVLLIACMNVASVMLARSAERAREFALRISLGATRMRLVAQLLTESALLAFGGGFVGLAIAWMLIRAAPHFVPANAIPGGPLELSVPVMWFTLAISALTCILFGLAPGMAAAQSDPNGALKESSRGSTAGLTRLRFRQTIVVAEIAAAVILLSATWLMIGSLRELTRANPGFDSRNVLALRIFLPAAKYDSPHVLEFSRTALERITSLPGIAAATVGTTLLPSSRDMWVPFQPDQLQPQAGGELPQALYAAVGPDYFRALAISLKRGRTFTDADDERAPLVAILNDAFVSRYYSGQDPIGRHIPLTRPLRLSGGEAVKAEVIGVVGNVRLDDLSEERPPMIYVPYRQNPFSRWMWFAARTNGDPAMAAQSIRKELLQIDPEQPVEQVASLAAMLDSQFAQPRFQTSLMSAFAALALLLAALGIYGVNAHFVAQRRAEIGLRMALGASRGAVLREVIARGLRPTAVGLAIGLIGALAMTFWLRSVLVGAAAADPLAFVGAALVLALVALAACYLPARSATRVDPAITLRAE